jgi:hypothetical protein
MPSLSVWGAAGRENEKPVNRDGETSINMVLNISRYASNVYTGISGRMHSRDQEVEYAKLHIANQIAMNRVCVVDYGYIDVEGYPRDNRALYDSNFNYDDKLVEDVLTQIKILQQYYFSNFTIVIGEDTGIAGRENPAVTRTGTERPLWVRSVPDMAGYYVGVGIGDKYYSPYKSIFAADINAAQIIAMEKQLYIRGYTLDKLDRNDSKLVNGNLGLSKAELRGFYILDRWIETDGTCYSLGIARKE